MTSLEQCFQDVEWYTRLEDELNQCHFGALTYIHIFRALPWVILFLFIHNTKIVFTSHLYTLSLYISTWEQFG